MYIKQFSLLFRKYSLYCYPRWWIGSVLSIFAVFAFFICSFYMNRREKLSYLEKELLQLKKQSVRFFEKEREHELFRKKYAKANPHFLESQLGALSLLKKEKSLLENLFKETSFGSSEPMRKRWDFLTGGSNTIVLTKTFEQETPHYFETHYKFVYPVEVEKEDVETILQIVEGENFPNAPQLIVKEFFLEKKEEGLYQIDMEIIQRVFR